MGFNLYLYVASDRRGMSQGEVFGFSFFSGSLRFPVDTEVVPCSCLHATAAITQASLGQLNQLKVASRL